MDFLGELNSAQKEAALATEGPLLILAGAGSGKTKTLTHRIAYLVAEHKVWPSHILAVTFTNKAAREMRERLAHLLGQSLDRSFMPWMGTFHSICVRLLRMDGQSIGVPHNFVIYDEDDRKGLIKQVMKSLSISDKEVKPSAVSGAISSAKNALQDPDEFEASAHYPFQQSVAKIYRAYEARRKEAKALDFDDLLIEAVRMLRENQQVRDKWRAQFEYILIDEYQDTNAAQYQLVKLLTNSRQNVCVVGDDWQSIYSWRGADFTNILNFERDFPGAKVVKLEQNYRSTGNILDAAHQVISKNTQRTDKELWTAEGPGAPVQVHGAYDESEEARLVVDRIVAQTAIGARRYDEYAILYRTNAQSYTLERALLQQRVPYQIIGGVRFYDRKVVKDVIAYVKLIYQPDDVMSFSRIVNVPARGIGATSVERFLNWHSGSGKNLIDALAMMGTETVVTGRAKTAMAQLGTTLRSVREDIDTTAPAVLIERLINETGYLASLIDGSLQSEDNQENIGSLLSDAQNFASLADFLEEVSLMSSADISSERNKVTLMTLHAAKGLEFPVVFMVGLEEGLLPHARVYEAGPAELEEERRLCYVGMTRAREELHISYAYSRVQFGNRAYNPVSRFITDMGSQVAVMTPDSAMGMRSQPRIGVSVNTQYRNGDDFGSSEYQDEPFYEDGAGFSEGDKVRSDAFGDGEIIEVDGLAVTVAFINGQTKKLNAEYARLQKL